MTTRSLQWISVTVLLSLVMLAATTRPCGAETWRVITFAPVITADVIGYPALIRLSEHGGTAGTLPARGSFRFHDTTGARLPFEIVTDGARPVGVRVRVPRLRADGGTQVRVAIRERKPASESSLPAGSVWAADYDLVLQGSPDEFRQRGTSSTNPPATAPGTSPEGVVGAALSFDGVRRHAALTGLKHTGQWVTPVAEIGVYSLPRPQGLASDETHLYFASHNDPHPADIIRVSRATGKRVETFSGVGPVHSAGGDYWGTRGTLVFSTGGSTPAGLLELTTAGRPVQSWNLSSLGYGKGALCAWKKEDRWLVLTSSGSRFRIGEVELERGGTWRLIREWAGPVSLGTPQGLDYHGGQLYYYTDGGLSSRDRSPGLITRLALHPGQASVSYVDQHAILIGGREAEGLTVLQDGTVMVGDSDGAGRGRIYQVGTAGGGSLVSTFKDFTVSLWFKQESAGTTPYPTLVARGSSAGTRDAFILHTLEGGRGLLRVKFGLTAPDWFGITSRPVPAGTWHHVAGVYDHARGVSLYLDGELVGTRARTRRHTLVDHGVPLTIGADMERGKLSHFFHGMLDEVRIARRAETPARIRATWQNVARYEQFVRVDDLPDGRVR